jgi:hypothetical protein
VIVFVGPSEAQIECNSPSKPSNSPRSHCLIKAQGCQRTKRAGFLVSVDPMPKRVGEFFMHH